MSSQGQSDNPTKSGSQNTTWNATREETWEAFSDKEKADITEIAKKFKGRFEKGEVYAKSTRRV